LFDRFIDIMTARKAKWHSNRLLDNWHA
jgi:hypothetical protein